MEDLFNSEGHSLNHLLEAVNVADVVQLAMVGLIQTADVA